MITGKLLSDKVSRKYIDLPRLSNGDWGLLLNVSDTTATWTPWGPREWTIFSIAPNNSRTYPKDDRYSKLSKVQLVILSAYWTGETIIHIFVFQDISTQQFTDHYFIIGWVPAGEFSVTCNILLI